MILFFIQGSVFPITHPPTPIWHLLPTYEKMKAQWDEMASVYTSIFLTLYDTTALSTTSPCGFACTCVGKDHFCTFLLKQVPIKWWRCWASCFQVTRVRESIIQCPPGSAISLKLPPAWPVRKPTSEGQISFRRGHCMNVQWLSHVWLFETPWTVAQHAPQSMGFSRQEYWSGFCHFLLQGIFPTQGLNSRLVHWQADSFSLSQLGSPQRTLAPRKQPPCQWPFLKSAPPKPLYESKDVILSYFRVFSFLSHTLPSLFMSSPLHHSSFFKYLFIYLVVPGLNCGTWDLWSSLWVCGI